VEGGNWSEGRLAEVILGENVTGFLVLDLDLGLSFVPKLIVRVSFAGMRGCFGEGTRFSAECCNADMALFFDAEEECVDFLLGVPFESVFVVGVDLFFMVPDTLKNESSGLKVAIDCVQDKGTRK